VTKDSHEPVSGGRTVFRLPLPGFIGRVCSLFTPETNNEETRTVPSSASGDQSPPADSGNGNEKTLLGSGRGSCLILGVLCGWLMWRSATPGANASTMFHAVFYGFGICYSCPPVGAILLLTLFGVGGVAAYFIGRDVCRWQRLVPVFTMFALTFTLLVLRVPCSLTFAASQAEFEELLENAPLDEYHGGDLDRKVGSFKVDRYGRDARGGVYFRTQAIGFLDTTSFGFAWKPNPQGSPFGGEDYSLSPLFGDWYVFTATDRF
jgi:hypothetical protein